MKYSSQALILALVAGLTVQPALRSAAAEPEVRALSGFTAVAVSGGIDLNIRQGSEFRVEAVASSGSPEAIVTTIEGATLVIRMSRTAGFFNWFTDYSVNVTLPVLAALSASGGSAVRTEGTVSGEQLSIAASGGSDMTVTLDYSKLEARISGGADLRLSGSAAEMHVQASGGSDVDARELRARLADVQTSGGADAAIAVSERLVAQASGGSDIVYSGNPVTADVDTSGGAEVSRR